MQSMNYNYDIGYLAPPPPMTLHVNVPKAKSVMIIDGEYFLHTTAKYTRVQRWMWKRFFNISIEEVDTE